MAGLEKCLLQSHAQAHYADLELWFCFVWSHVYGGRTPSRSIPRDRLCWQHVCALQHFACASSDSYIRGKAQLATTVNCCMFRRSTALWHGNSCYTCDAAYDMSRLCFEHHAALLCYSLCDMIWYKVLVNNMAGVVMFW